MPKLRKLDLDIKYFGPIRTSPELTLILISDSETCFANSSPLEKDVLVENFKTVGGKLLLAWTGKFKTDIFEISQDDLDRHYTKK